MFCFLLVHYRASSSLNRDVVGVVEPLLGDDVIFFVTITKQKIETKRNMKIFMTDLLNLNLLMLDLS